MCICFNNIQVFSKHYWTPTMCLIPSWAFLLKLRLKGSVSSHTNLQRRGGWQLSLSTSVLVATELAEKFLQVFPQHLTENPEWTYWLILWTKVSWEQEEKWLGCAWGIFKVCTEEVPWRQEVTRRAGSDTRRRKWHGGRKWCGGRLKESYQTEKQRTRGYARRCVECLMNMIPLIFMMSL